jgi:ATP-dependent Clp protease protease subunit
LCEFILKANYVFPKDQPVTIFLNSPGGDVYSGFGTIDLMECSKVKIQTVTIGIVASMASLIFTAGTKGMRIMSKNSFIMTHQFSGYFEGKYHEMIAQRTHEDDLQQRFIQHFLRHSKMNEEEIKDILLRSSDTYISAKEALRWGLCDKIQDPWG